MTFYYLHRRKEQVKFKLNGLLNIFKTLIGCFTKQHLTHDIIK